MPGKKAIFTQGYCCAKSSSIKGLNKIAFLLVTCVLVGCEQISSARPSSTPLMTNQSVTLSPSATIPPISSPTALQQMEPTGTLTSIPPTTAPTPAFTLTPALQFQCLDVQPELPSDVKLSGKLVFHEYGSDGQTFLLNLEDGTKQILPEFGDFRISPNASWLAYSVSSEKPEDRQIVVMSADGQEEQRIVWGEKNVFRLAGWLDDERLLLINYDVDPAVLWSMLVLNPFTLEREEIPTDYPDFCQCGDAMSNVIFANAPQVLEPSLRFVIYPRWGRIGEGGGFYFSLWDRQERQELAKVKEGSDFFLDPLWNRNGGYFLIPASTDTDEGKVMEWYRVSKAGEVSQLTHFGDFYANAVISPASLSPDGHYLAFWLDTKSIQERDRQLVVMNLETEMATNYCISGTLTPIWAPDGRYLLVENNPALDQYVEIVVDTVDGWAAQISENLFPYGWLRSP